MFKKYFLTILLIILIFVFHQSVILNFQWRLNFWPVILVFILFAFNHQLALIWTIVSGFLLDLYSVLPFGTNLVILFICLYVIYLLAKNFITNRSFLSFLILSILATLLFNALIFLFQESIAWLVNFNKLIIINLNTIFVQLLSNVILASLLFFITLKFSKRLQTDSIVSQ